MSFISVCIPTYEMNGKGVEFLEFSFRKLSDQTFKDFDVIISDHSLSDIIEKLCNKWKIKLDIKYYKNYNNIGSSSANINNAISKSTSNWIKILFQDDFMYDKDSLMKLYNYICLNESSNWIVSGCEHSDDGINMYRSFIPRWNNEIHLGNNTISSPSVLCIKNVDNNIYFDEKLIWLMDVDYYRKLYDKYGEPSFIYDILVVNRTWGNRLSDTIDNTTKTNEVEILRKKYN